MKIHKSILNSSLRRRSNTELPDTTDAEDKGKANPAPKAKSKKAPAKKAAAKPGKKDAKKPAAKKTAKPAKEKKEPTPRKPRVEGRVDLVYRSGPERAIAIAMAEHRKLGEGVKVDNCTVGYKVAGTKATALHDDYIALRTGWRKAQDELTAKFLAKAK